MRQLLSKEDIRLFYYGMIFQIISKGSSLFSHTFNIDDLIFWTRDYNYTTLLPAAIRDGRFTHPFFAGLEGFLGINPSLSFTVSTLLFMGCITISSIIVCHILGIQKNHKTSLIVIGFISLHPYLTDFYTWRIATFNGGLPFVFAGLSLLWGSKSNKAIAFAIVTFALSLGIHQIPLEFYASVLCCSALYKYLHFSGVINACSLSKINPRTETINLLRMVLILFAGTILYIILAKLYISHMLDLSQGSIETLSRDQIIIFKDPTLVLSRILELFSLISIKDPLISEGSRLLLFSLLLISTIFIFLRSNSVFQGFRLIVAMLLALIITTIFSIGLTVVPVAWIPVFRNIFSISLLWAIVAVISYQTANDMFKRVTVIIVGLLFIAFAAKDNEMLTDQMRANARDTSMMNRIAADIEKIPEFKNLQTLAFIGTSPVSLQNLNSAADLSTGWNSYGTTLSMFAIPWNGYLVKLYNEVTGYRMRSVNSDKLSLLKNSCLQSTWPEIGSVFVIDQSAVICLGGKNEIIYSELDMRHNYN